MPLPGDWNCPQTIESNTPISGSVLYENATVADLGISETTYTFGGGQTITVRVSGTSDDPAE